MLWTRRSFLALLGTGVTATLVDPRILRAPHGRAPVLPAPVARAFLLDITAASRVDTVAKFSIARNGQLLLCTTLGPRDVFRWVAAPGHELPLEGLQNLSDADLDVTMIIRRGEEIVCISHDQREFSLDTATPWSRGSLRERALTAYPTGSFRTYIEHEKELGL